LRYLKQFLGIFFIPVKGYENWATKTTLLIHLFMISLVSSVSGLIYAETTIAEINFGHRNVNI